MSDAAAKYLSKSIVVSACIAGSVFLMAQGADGWGWLIFIAIVVLA